MSDIPASEQVEMEKVDEYACGDCKGIGEKNETQEPSAPTDITSILSFPNVLKTIKTLASWADLEALRQVNEDFYELFDSTYCDIVNTALNFGYDHKSCVEDFKFLGEAEDEVSDEDEVPKDSTSDEEEANAMIETIQDIFNTDYNEHKNDFQCKICVCLKDGQRILAENWTPAIAHIYRKLSLNAKWLDRSPENENEVDMENFHKIIPHVAPYITAICLSFDQLKEIPTGAEYSDFLNQFIKLENIEIRCLTGFSHFFKPKNPKSVDELAIGLENLKTKPKIHFKLTKFDDREVILAKFATKENTTFEIEIGMDYLNDMAWNTAKLAQFQNICAHYGNLKNIRYDIKVRDLPLDQFKVFTRLCTQIGTQIDSMLLDLGTPGTPWFDEEVNSKEIWKCLDQLSSFVTRMELCQPQPEVSTMESPWDILLHEINWPKLTHLSIYKYKTPLNILKNFGTNLEYLKLQIDQDLCIFSNSQQSDKENVAEYFAHLDKLTELTFNLAKDADKISEGSELDEYLKVILPKLKRVVYCKGPDLTFLDSLMESSEEYES